MTATAVAPAPAEPQVRVRVWLGSHAFIDWTGGAAAAAGFAAAQERRFKAARVTAEPQPAAAERP
ncbi:MAG TPA: hypothetical protein VGD71_10090 [Kribbella sp.]